MLIITRKENEEVMINHDISIKILSISENQVKLGITAPESVTIYRAELYKKIKEMNIKASSNEITLKVDKLTLNKLNNDIR